MTYPRCIHIATNDLNSLIFTAESYSIAHKYHMFWVNFSVSRHLGCFHVFTVVNSAATNIGVHVSFRTMFFSGYMPRRGIAGSYDSSVLGF